MISVAVGINMGLLGGGGAAEPDKTLVVETFLANGTWTSPAVDFWHEDGTASAAAVELWAAGGGGTTATGGGGGGGYSRSKVTGLAESTGYAFVVPAGGAANTNGADATFESTIVVAKGGLSGTNGGTGGAAASGTGDTKFSGGNGQVGAGNTTGGGGAGDAANGGTGPGGASNGGYGALTATGRTVGAGGGSSGAGQSAGARGEGRVTYAIEATEGFPRVTGRSWGRSAAGGTSHAVTMPSGIVAGELLVLIVSSDGVPAITVAGWTALTQVDEGTSQVSGRAFYKTAAGSDTATIATDASEEVSYEVLRIASAGTPEWTTASGSSTNPDPPTHTPSGGSAKYLWLACAGWDGGNTAPTGIPASYSSFITVPARDTTGTILAVCERFNEASSENPAVIPAATEQWWSATISVPPA